MSKHAPGIRITPKGRIAVALMPDYNDERLEAAANRVWDEVKDAFAQRDALLAACRLVMDAEFGKDWKAGSLPGNCDNTYWGRVAAAIAAAQGPEGGA